MDDKEQMISASSMGFTEEDLKDVPEAKPVEEPEKEEKPEATPQPEAKPQEEAKPEDHQTEETAPASEGNPQTEAPAENHGNLSKALAEERNRRKSLADENASLRSQLQQIKQQQAQAQRPQVPPQTKQDIMKYAREKAIKDMNLKDVDDLMFTAPDKYDELQQRIGAISAGMELQYQTRYATRERNISFARSIMSDPDINTIMAKGTEMLNDMKRKDSMPIDTAFNNVDQGIGTDKDFQIISDFRDKVKAAIAGAQAQPVQETNPLEQAAALPKAGALTGANPVQPKITNEEILKAVREGRENELPKEIQRAIDDIIG